MAGMTALMVACIASAAAQPVDKPPLEASDLAAYFDGYLAAELERADIAGAALVIAKDGTGTRVPALRQACMVDFPSTSK
jgi:hypothetical protein